MTYLAWSYNLPRLLFLVIIKGLQCAKTRVSISVHVMLFLLTIPQRTKVLFFCMKTSNQKFEEKKSVVYNFRQAIKKFKKKLGVGNPPLTFITCKKYIFNTFLKKEILEKKNKLISGISSSTHSYQLFSTKREKGGIAMTSFTNTAFCLKSSMRYYNILCFRSKILGEKCSKLIYVSWTT